MSTSRTVAVLTVVAVPLMLAGHMAGRAAPTAETDGTMKASFEALQKKLPNVVANWAKKCDWVEPKNVKTEIKLARFTGPSEAKLTLLVTMNFSGIAERDISLNVNFYLRYFNGRWTTIGADYPPKPAETVIALMLAIDRASEK